MCLVCGSGPFGGDSGFDDVAGEAFQDGDAEVVLAGSIFGTVLHANEQELGWGIWQREADGEAFAGAAGAR